MNLFRKAVSIMLSIMLITPYFSSITSTSHASTINFEKYKSFNTFASQVSKMAVKTNQLREKQFINLKKQQRSEGKTNSVLFRKKDKLKINKKADETKTVSNHKKLSESSILSDPSLSTKRIMIKTDGMVLTSTYGATKAISGPNNLYVLQYSTLVQAKRAQLIYKKNKHILFTALDSHVKAAELNGAQSPVTSTSGNLNWGTERVNASGFKRSLPEGKPNIVVAVLDTGVQEDHPFIKDRLTLDKQWDFVAKDNDASDENGHGTHVSGIIADATPENVKILPIRVLDDFGYGEDIDIATAIQYAADNGAKIISLSLTGQTDPDKEKLFEDAIDYANRKGASVIVAAGNESDDTQNYLPAKIQSAITVAATTNSDNIADYSNYGDAVDVAAPGTSVLSSYIGSDYEVMSGTSMATPLVAAAAALILSKDNTLKPEQVQDKIKNNVDDKGEQGIDPIFGAGILHLSSAQGAQDDSIIIAEPLTNVNLDKLIHTDLEKELSDNIYRWQIDGYGEFSPGEGFNGDVSNYDQLLNLRYLSVFDDPESQTDNVTDLTQLNSLINLKGLELFETSELNATNNLTGLKNLSVFYYENSGTIDLEGISHLPKLNLLYLEYGKINHFEPLNTLPNLTELDFIGTEVSNFSTLPHDSMLENIMIIFSNVEDFTGISNLGSLKSLYILGTKINNTEPLSGLTGLYELFLLDNHIKDISALANLNNLKSLAIMGNLVDDISPIKNLIKLEELGLSGNRVENLPDLSHLSNLTLLFLDDNDIRSVETLKSLNNLEYLSLAGNYVSDVSTLTNLPKLKTLDLSNNFIEDSSSLHSLISLEELNLGSNWIEDLSAISFNPKLKVLDVENNHITSIDSLLNITNLAYVDLSDNYVDISEGTPGKNIIDELLIKGTEVYYYSQNESPFVPVKPSSIILNSESISIPIGVQKQLKVLYNPNETNYQGVVWESVDRNVAVIDRYGNVTAVGEGTTSIKATTIKDNKSVNCKITVTAPQPVSLSNDKLEGLIRDFIGKAPDQILFDADLLNITFLDLTDTGIEDISGINQLTNLEFLILNDNNISNLNPMTGLENLESLSVMNNPVKTYSSLNELTSLKELYLDRTGISDMHFLSNFNNLETLSLTENGISDISSLSGLEKLTTLWLDKNNIENITSLSRMKDLYSLYLNDNLLSDLTPLTELTQLVDLNLDNNQISDMSPLSSLSGLQYLFLNNNRIFDISQLIELNNLQWLTLNENYLDTSDNSITMGLINELMNRFVYVEFENQQPAFVDRVSFDQKEYTISFGSNLTLNPIITPTHALDKSGKWTSSDENIVVVNENGIVKTIDIGKATITFATTDGEKLATCIIKVEPSKEQKAAIDAVVTAENTETVASVETAWELVNPLPSGSIKLDLTKRLSKLAQKFVDRTINWELIKAKNTLQKAVVSDLNLPTTIKGFTSKFEWSSSNPNVISKSGKVSRPEYKDGDQTVALTATYTSGGTTFHKKIEVKVSSKYEVLISPKDTVSGILIDGIDSVIKGMGVISNPDVKKVEVKLNVTPIVDFSKSFSINRAKYNLSSLNKELLSVFDFKLLMNLYGLTDNLLDSEKIEGHFNGLLTIKIPIPNQFKNREELEIIYISNTGNIETMDSDIVYNEGKMYLKFQTNHFSNYGIIAKKISNLTNASSVIKLQNATNTPNTQSLQNNDDKETSGTPSKTNPQNKPITKATMKEPAHEDDSMQTYLIVLLSLLGTVILLVSILKFRSLKKQ